MIRIDRITKSFGPGRTAVSDVSFEVAEGETLVLLGTSGSGKTTTLRMVNRLLEPSSGTIYVGGRDIRSLPVETLRRGIGYVLQESGLFPHYTVAENIAVVPTLLRWDARRIADRSAALLEKLHLSPGEYMDTYPTQLSGGQAQRVGLARALAADQPVLLMDEPFGALDPITRAHVRKDFRALDEVRKKTVLLVTHDVAEAFELGDKICLMDEGKVVQWGRPEELLLRPASDFVRTFFDGERLLLELSVVKVSEIFPGDAQPDSRDTLPDSRDTLPDSGDALPDSRDALPDSASVRAAAGDPLPASTSLRAALEAALAAPDGKVRIASRSLTAGALMDAYQAHKQR